MYPHAPATPAPVTPTAAPRAALPAEPGFFHHHGLWAPGIRLFRHLGFRGKAALISLSFVLPIGLLLVLLLQAMQAQIHFAQQEREGVAAIGRLAPVLHGLLQARNATRAVLGGHPAQADYQTARQATDAALRALDEHLAASGDPLQLAKPVAQLREAWVATALAVNGVDAQGRTVFGPVTAATKALLNRIGDDSNLVLDPDVDSFYTVNALVLTLPRLAEDLGQVWGWGTYAAQQGSLTAEQTHRFVGWVHGANTQADSLREYLQRAVQANGALAQALDPAVLAQSTAFGQRADAMARGQQPRDAAALYAAGQAALAQLFGLYQRGLPALDALLVRRIDGLAQGRLLALGVVAAGLLLAAYMFHSFYRVLDGGVGALTRHIEALRQGDLRPTTPPWGRDEVAGLMRALDDMRQGLGVLVGQVNDSSHALLSRAHGISGDARDLAARTEASAAALEQTAASMEQIAVTVRHTADASRDAAALARDNAAVAGQGGSLVAEVVRTMDEVRQSSDRIGAIIGVIDGIAFRTNLLALNAAVEAARAGEQGKGFAVVATEVRALAGRSAQAAQEVKQLIGGSMGVVAACTTRVQEAGATMDALVHNADRIKTLLADISNGAAEQSAGIGQVGAAVQELDGNTQRNARLVQDTAGTADAMRQQAELLAERVSRFTLQPA